MHEIRHWNGINALQVARSAGGVLVTTAPRHNLVVFGDAPAAAPEILQKSSASLRFRGLTEEDDRAARATLGFYSDLQSLNSEDAITWSVFGNLAYLPGIDRHVVWTRILERIGEPPLESIPTCWLWRRLPHPEKPESNGGPEIDFGCLARDTLILGEAKWNSPLGARQGINKDRSQLDLRVDYLERLAPKVFPEAKRRVVLGVGRRADLFCDSTAIGVHCLTWDDVIACFEGNLREELRRYLAWKVEHSTALRSEIPST